VLHLAIVGVFQEVHWSALGSRKPNILFCV